MDIFRRFAMEHLSVSRQKMTGQLRYTHALSFRIPRACIFWGQQILTKRNQRLFVKLYTYMFKKEKKYVRELLSFADHWRCADGPDVIY